MTQSGGEGNEGIARPSFDYSALDDDRAVVFAFRGEFDGHAATDVRPLIGQVLPSESVVIDLGNVTFIDSLGLRVLIEWHERLRQGGGTLRLRNVPHPVRRILHVAAVADLFDQDHTGSSDA